MNTVTELQRSNMSELSSKILPSFGSVLLRSAQKALPVRAVSMDCEGQCLSGCKNACITVSK